MTDLVRTSNSVASGLSYLHGGHGDPLLFVHGIPGSAAVWRPVFDLLPGGLAVFAPDLIGFGSSCSTGGGVDALGLDAQATALLALLDELEVGAVTVVTHDFGGPVALRMLSRRPDLVNGLVLSSTNAFGDTPVPFPLSTIFWPIVGPLAAHALFSPPSLRLMLRTGTGTAGSKVDAGTYVGDGHQAASIRKLFEHSLRNLHEVYGPLEAVLPRIDVPTAVVWGERDPFFGVAHGRRTADAIRGATFTVVPDAGHFLPGERPESYVAAIEAVRRAADRGAPERQGRPGAARR